MTRSLGIACLLIAFAGCGRPAQIGADEEAFKAVDALYTAVSLRNAGHVDRCEATLKGLRASGKLPDAAAGELEAIIAEARAGRWEPAQGRLGDFIRGQKRPS